MNAGLILCIVFSLIVTVMALVLIMTFVDMIYNEYRGSPSPPAPDPWTEIKPLIYVESSGRCPKLERVL